MKFFILGDSWGVGEWIEKDRRLKAVPNTGIDHWLQKSNHQCMNVSVGSAANFGQLRHAYWTLKEKFDYDYIIWFYTEPFRDIIETVIHDSAESALQYPEFDIQDFPKCDYITQQNFKYAQMMYDEFKIPFIVVGGACPVPKEIDSYTFCHHKIANWAAELLNLNFKFPNYAWGSWRKFEGILSYYNLSEKDFILAEHENLEKTNIIIKTSVASKNFPDNAHPSRECFRDLAARILQMI